MLRKRIAVLATTVIIVLTSFSGCAQQADNASSGIPSSENSVGIDNGADSEEIIDIEIWHVNNGFPAVEKGSETYEFYKDLLGVGVIQPYVEWNSGETYQQQLNLRIAANDLPDLFMPVNGMEVTLAQNGAILDLTDTLPEMAPHLWDVIPEEQWALASSYDPDGNDRIYFVPGVLNYGLEAGMIRQDWLDQLGLDMPTTQDEFVKVLEAFRDNDLNGNGINDEIPTGGRQQAKWFDHLFAMYGIAMWEGDPDWDIYNGELTFSAVTPNMKDALAFINQLYMDGLMDPETLLNDKSKWDGKIGSGRVGVYYHWVETVYNRVEDIEKATGEQADYRVLPPISAPGYDAYYTTKSYRSPIFVVKNQDDQKKIDACFKVLDAYGNKDLWYQFYLGVEGMHSEMQDGNLIRLPEDKGTQENLTLVPYKFIQDLDFQTLMLTDMITPSREWSLSQGVRNLQENVNYVKRIAGDGLPSYVYNDYPDIQNNTLYVEYASKIILGEYSIDKFDEFVDRWYSSGGEEVTQLAREWYATVDK